MKEAEINSRDSIQQDLPSPWIDAYAGKWNWILTILLVGTWKRNYLDLIQPNIFHRFNAYERYGTELSDIRSRRK